jgi:hypothetical protein
MDKKKESISKKALQALIKSLDAQEEAHNSTMRYHRTKKLLI